MANDDITGKLFNRASLKQLFKNGVKPTQKSFAELIESTVNKVDDGFSKDMQNGLMLSPEGESSESLLSFYRKIDDLKPAWSVQLNQANDQFGLRFMDGKTDKSLLYLKQGGFLGVANENPEYPLHVTGMAGLDGRLGTFAKGTVPADGKWHPIVSKLTGCQGFEVVAKAAGTPRRGSTL
ncbi:hypothetical protein KFE98_20025 [bacterium SCSIO 12741]|nr:hypothetical protein KFE98_20025 [bacterium SCSIO 12741]